MKLQCCGAAAGCLLLPLVGIPILVAGFSTLTQSAATEDSNQVSVAFPPQGQLAGFATAAQTTGVPEALLMEALWGPVSMRHPYVTDAIGDSFWHWPSKQRAPVIIPVKPDNHLGRIGQQSSCFTLHMHNSMPRQNPTLKKIKVPSVAKPTLLKELHRMNVNQFTIFNDLDHLSKDIRRTWEVK